MNNGLMGFPLGSDQNTDILARRTTDGSTAAIRFYGYFSRMYSLYLCVFSGIYILDPGGVLNLRISTNGSTPDTAANYYQGGTGAMSVASSIDIGHGSVWAANSEVSGRLLFYDPLNNNGAYWKWVETFMMGNNSGGTPISVAGAGSHYNVQQPSRGFEITYDAGGRMKGGDIVLYGLRNRRV